MPIEKDIAEDVGPLVTPGVLPNHIMRKVIDVVATKAIKTKEIYKDQPYRALAIVSAFVGFRTAYKLLDRHLENDN